MIKITVRTQFDKRKLKKKAETATFTSLSEAGGAVRKTAKRSIRKCKRHPSPEPAAHANRHAQASDSVRRHQQPNRCRNRSCERDRWTDWNLHEFGGVATKRRKLKPHRFKVGEHGPSVPYNTEARPSLRGSNCDLRRKPPSNSLDCRGERTAQ